MAENRWRKIEVRMWGDEKFRALSSVGPSGQALWIYLLTGPHTGPIPGLFRAGRAALAEELGWEQQAFDKAFQEAFALGMVKADWKARVVFIPKAIKCNSPQSPNVIISWASEWQLIPECELKCEAYQVVRSAIYECGEAFQKAFDKAFAKPYPKTMANQEQEQEQEQEENPLPQIAFADVPLKGSGIKLTDSQIQKLYESYPRKRDPLEAKKAIRKAISVVMAGDPDHPAMLLIEALDYLAQRVTLYARSIQGSDQKYVPYPASWFNAGSFWDDDREWSKHNGSPDNSKPRVIVDPGDVLDRQLKEQTQAKGQSI
jgi:hypothetical protein